MITTILLAAICQQIGSGQTPKQPSYEIALGPTKVVDINVSDVNWQVEGHAFIYEKKEDDGKSVGIFNANLQKGKIVLRLSRDERYTTAWFRGVPCAMVMTTESSRTADKSSTKLRVILLDSSDMTSKELFSEIYPGDTAPRIDCRLSPTLRHAVVSFWSDSQVSNLVLCSGQSKLVPAPELDRAFASGIDGPYWTTAGTAIFGPTKGKQPTFSVSHAQTNLGDGARTLFSSNLTPTKFVTPAVGSPVLELMADQPVLRPIRQPGLWQNQGIKMVPMTTVTQPILIQRQGKSVQEVGTWLTRGRQPDSPSTFLAVNASQVWPAFMNGGVAYLIDGALFYRPVLK